MRDIFVLPFFWIFGQSALALGSYLYLCVAYAGILQTSQQGLDHGVDAARGSC